jgi:hypothetical protein
LDITEYEVNQKYILKRGNSHVRQQQEDRGYVPRGQDHSDRSVLYDFLSLAHPTPNAAFVLD